MNWMALCALAVIAVPLAALGDGQSKDADMDGNARTCYVAVGGRDDADGSREHPFATIQKAADVMQPGDTCLLRGGTYRQTVKLKARGTAQRPIRFAAFPAEVVILSGADPLACNWQVHQGRILKTKVDRRFEQLFVDGRMMIEARWPNATFGQMLDRSCWATTAEGSEHGKLIDPALAATGIDWTGAIAVLNVAHQFFSWTRPVTKHSKGGDTLEYPADLHGLAGIDTAGTPPSAPVRKKWTGNSYYLFGKLEALDSPGEWFLDGQAGVLYLWPPDGVDIAAATVEAKARDYVFEAEDASYVQLEGLHFFAAAFRLANCDHCLLEGCHLRFPVFGRELTDLSPSRKPMPVAVVSGSHNVLRNCSVMHSPTAGLAVGGTHNTIENCLAANFCWNGSLRYAGISVHPTKNYNDPDAPTDRKGENVVRDSTACRGGNVLVHAFGMPNVVERCHLFDGGRACKDVSLLYTHSPVIAGTVFRYNWVHGCASEHISLGIRGDDQTRGLTVHHNVVWGCGWDGIVAKGDNNGVFNNTCLDNGTRDGYADILLFSSPEPLRAWRSQWPLLREQNAHSKAFNNIAVLKGVRRKQDYALPKGELANNVEYAAGLLEDPGNLDFRPKEGSALIDAGTHVSGITDGFVGKAPDVGAYERGGERWVPGHRNAVRVWAGPDAGTILMALALPPLRPVTVKIAGADVTFNEDNWMQPQTVKLPNGSAEGRIPLALDRPAWQGVVETKDIARPTGAACPLPPLCDVDVKAPKAR